MQHLFSYFYQWFPHFFSAYTQQGVYRYLSRFLSARKQLAITTFAEALHNCFKDGLNGTRDYRALAGGPLIELAMHGGMAKFLVNATGYGFSHTVAAASVMFVVFLVAYVKPCNLAIANISLCYHMMLLGIVIMFIYLWEYDLSSGTSILQATFIATLFIPHILVALWTGYALTKYNYAYEIWV